MTDDENERDKRELIELNIKIGEAEQQRDRRSEFFENLLSKQLIFRRANGKVVGKKDFLTSLQEPNPFTDRKSLDIEVTPQGDRALVTLVVKTKSPKGEEGRYRNIRLFTRTDDEWQLEFWYNYDLTSL